MKPHTLAEIGRTLVIALAYLALGGQLPWFIIPMGSSAVLLFCVPASPLAQPSPSLAGNLVSALIGVGCYRWLGETGAAVAYTPDLTEGGIEIALRSLSYTYERQGRSPYGRLCRQVANIAVEVAFRRYLSQNNIPFEVKASTPFTDRERFDVVLYGHRCDLKSYLISRREQITEIRNNPATLMDAPALVPSDSHAGDGHSYNDLYLFAFMSGLVASSQEDLQKVVSKNQPHYLVHTMPSGWSKPQNWIPLGALTLKSESAEELIVEISGQDEGRGFVTRVLSLPPKVRVTVDDPFFSVMAIHVRNIPSARIGIHSPAFKEAHVIAPLEWGNLCSTAWTSR